MRGKLAITNGVVTSPLRSEAEARADRRKKLMREAVLEERLAREDREDAAAEEGYCRHAQAIWSGR
jgi:hypothetical protein